MRRPTNHRITRAASRVTRAAYRIGAALHRAVAASSARLRELASLPAAAAAALLGNLAVHELPSLPPALPVLALAVAVVLALLGPCRWLALGAAAFAWTAWAAEQRLDDRWVGEGSVDVALAGWIDAFPAVDRDRVAFSFRVERASRDGVPGRVRLSWYDAPDGLAAGTPLEVVARLRAPRGFKNPGLFDYERWLFVEGYGATGYVREGDVAEPGASLARRWLALRARLAERISVRMESSAAALTTALSLGERTAFEDEHWTVLRRTGTTHLVAISGMHVGLIATMSFWLLLRLGLRLPYAAARYAWEAAACLTALVAAFYAALAGFAVPTQRALVMLLVVLAVVVTKRRTPLGFGLSVALAVLIFYDPFATLSASFWLSFGAVALLVMLASRERLRDRLGDRLRGERRGIAARATRWLVAFARLQWCITLGLVPLLVAYFGELSLVSPIVNLAAIPFFGFVLVPLTLAAAACLNFGSDGLGLVALTEHLAVAAWHVLGSVSAWPWASIEVSMPGAGVVFFAAVWAALPLHALPGRRLAWLAALGLGIESPHRPAHGVVDVTVADVGQGLAVLVETENHRLLYDAGPVFRSGFDTGGEIVAPLAKRAGRSDLELLVLSHGDSDHAGGARAVLDAFPDARVLHGPDIETPFIRADGTRASSQVCARGRRWTWDGVQFEILHPEPGFAPLGNESSCVLEIRTQLHSILLTGDVEARGERALVGHGSLEADLVVVPHHGSRTSSSPAFVSAVRPRYAIVGAGHDNRWGFPRPEVRERWEALGAAVVVTGDVGAVRLTLGATPFTLRTARGARKRYWEPERAPVPGESMGAAL